MTEYDKAISFEELYKALQKCQKGVIWKDSVAGYSMNGLKNTRNLRKALLNNSYKVSKYQKFKVYEPKEREIMATRIKDRQYQWSVCDNILYQEITKHFINNNCACQRGKGVDYALQKMKVMLWSYYRENKNNAGSVLQCDVRKYFPNTRHDIAIEKVIKAVKNKEAAMCACEIIESFSEAHIEEKLRYYVSEEEASKKAHALTILRIEVVITKIFARDKYNIVLKESREKAEKLLSDIKIESIAKFTAWVLQDKFKGIGLGSQVSQLIELLVLNDLDHFIKEKLRIKRYIRYMDDFILIHEDKVYLRYCRNEIEKYLNNIGFSLNEKTGIYSIRQGIKFLKWRFILTDTGKVVMKMNRKCITKQRRKMRKLKEKLDAGKITIEDVENNFRSFRANADRGDTKSITWNMQKYYKELFGTFPPDRKKKKR